MQSEGTTCSSFIDVTLLRGLEPVMSMEEQAMVTAMMVSGDPNELAKASKILYDLTVLLKEGVYAVNQRTDAHQSHLKDSFRSGFQPRPRPGFNNREERVAKAKYDNDLQDKARAATLPLPVRMPRFEVIDSFDPEHNQQQQQAQAPPRKLLGIVRLPGPRAVRPSLCFVDWKTDGSLSAAFTKLTVKDDRRKICKNPDLLKDSTGAPVLVEHEFHPSPGFDEIVHCAARGYETPVCLDEPRVLISRTLNDAAKLALQRGDVITHVNGQEFIGNAQDLNLLLQGLHADSGTTKFEIIVNAEPCIAQALKYRALASGAELSAI